MNKKLIIGIVGLIVLVGAVAVILSLSGKKNESSSTSMEQASFSAKLVDACQALTPEIATQYLGETPETSDTPSGEASSDDVNVSNCAYSTKFVVGQPASLKSASLLARSAKTRAGADSNKSVFTDQRPTDAQDIASYGDEAYWSPSMGQFNILKNNNWYIIQAGGVQVGARTIEDTKRLADLVISNL